MGNAPQQFPVSAAKIHDLAAVGAGFGSVGKAVLKEIAAEVYRYTGDERAWTLFEDWWNGVPPQTAMEAATKMDEYLQLDSQRQEEPERIKGSNVYVHTDFVSEDDCGNQVRVVLVYKGDNSSDNDQLEHKAESDDEEHTEDGSYDFNIIRRAQFFAVSFSGMLENNAYTVRRFVFPTKTYLNNFLTFGGAKDENDKYVMGRIAQVLENADHELEHHKIVGQQEHSRFTKCEGGFSTPYHALESAGRMLYALPGPKAIAGVLHYGRFHQDAATEGREVAPRGRPYLIKKEAAKQIAKNMKDLLKLDLDDENLPAMSNIPQGVLIDHNDRARTLRTTFKQVTSVSCSGGDGIGGVRHRLRVVTVQHSIESASSVATSALLQYGVRLEGDGRGPPRFVLAEGEEGLRSFIDGRNWVWDDYSRKLLRFFLDKRGQPQAGTCSESLQVRELHPSAGPVDNGSDSATRSSFFVQPVDLRPATTVHSVANISFNDPTAMVCSLLLVFMLAVFWKFRVKLFGWLRSGGAHPRNAAETEPVRRSCRQRLGYQCAARYGAMGHDIETGTIASEATNAGRNQKKPRDAERPCTSMLDDHCAPGGTRTASSASARASADVNSVDMCVVIDGRKTTTTGTVAAACGSEGDDPIDRHSATRGSKSSFPASSIINYEPSNLLGTSLNVPLDKANKDATDAGIIAANKNRGKGPLSSIPSSIFDKERGSTAVGMGLQVSLDKDKGTTGAGLTAASSKPKHVSGAGSSIPSSIFHEEQHNALGMSVLTTQSQRWKTLRGNVAYPRDEYGEGSANGESRS
ncbi:unnamed protein product [Amoebophrya sp. A25]|nr:unnamed protein product [Amoebophrya sp. A25]|eukprot:GSA25T00010817001.1